MRHLAEIVALYLEIDGKLEFESELLLAAGRSPIKIAAQQIVNDQAYFILAWGQFEAAIDEACRSSIRARLARPDWPDRRAWDIYNPDDRRLSGLSFEDRVALVVDRVGGRGSDWAVIMQLYGLRNKIAHGNLQLEGIEVDNAAAQFWILQSRLARK